MDDLELPDQLTPSTAAEQNKTIGDLTRAPLVDVLFEDFGELPKKSKIDLDEFAVINVSPSVVPNPYLPSFRVFAYNISGANMISDAPEDTDGGSADSPEESKKKKKKKKGKKGRDHKHKHNGGENSTIDCKKEQNQEKWACRPKKPQHASEEAPSRTNTLWTPLGYAQARIFCCFVCQWLIVRLIMTVLAAGCGNCQQEQQTKVQARVSDVRVAITAPRDYGSGSGRGGTDPTGTVRRRGRRKQFVPLPGSAEGAATVTEGVERDTDEVEICAVQAGGPDGGLIRAACATSRRWLTDETAQAF